MLAASIGSSVFFAIRFVVAVVRAVVGSQIEPARARQCLVKASRIVPGTLSGCPGTSKSVPNVCWERLGSVSGSPRCAPRAPRESTKAPRNARERAQERPGVRRSGQNRFQGTSGSERIEYFPCSIAEKRFRCEFGTISVDFGLTQKDGEPSQVLRLLAKTEVRLFALPIDSLARCHLGKQRKSTLGSSQNRRKRRLGANRAIFSVAFGQPLRPRRPGRAAQAAQASGPGGPGGPGGQPSQPESEAMRGAAGAIR